MEEEWTGLLIGNIKSGMPKQLVDELCSGVMFSSNQISHRLKLLFQMADMVQKRYGRKITGLNLQSGDMNENNIGKITD